MAEIAELTECILGFRDERDWQQFHTPWNLAAALSVEAAELQELFLWEGGDEGDDRSGTPESQRDEIADVLIYALLFCHETGIDAERAIRRKLEKNRRRYPVEEARGRSVKYTELDGD